MNAVGLDCSGILGADTQLLAFARTGRLRHLPEALRILDADSHMLGIVASIDFVGASTRFVAISTGHVTDVGGNTSGDRRQRRLQAGADVAILPRLKLMGSAAWERGQYSRFDPSFLTGRPDFVTYSEIGA